LVVVDLEELCLFVEKFVSWQDRSDKENVDP